MATPSINNLLAIFVVLTFCTCSNSSQTKENTLPDNRTSFNKNAENEHQISIKENVVSPVQEDSIIYDREIFPKETGLFAKLLTTGVFHEDEVQPTAANENWIGLFKGKNGWYLAQTKIITSKVYDPIIDEDSLLNKTGWEVQTINKDTSIVLMAGLKELKPGKVISKLLSKNNIYPGDTLKFNYSGNNYQLFATGGKRRVQDNPEWFEVWNYKLYLKAMKNGKTVTDLLYATPGFDDAMTNIIFAGDIDGDGFLDLLIDTSNHYNVSSPTLYTSKPAENSKLIKVVGTFKTVGC